MKKAKGKARGGKTAARKTAARKQAARRKAPAHAYQEGSVESVRARPSGTDDSDRSGEGTRPAPGVRPAERGRDAFVSSEIGGKTTVPGKDPRTRS
jgi:hypothetical protein